MPPLYSSHSPPFDHGDYSQTVIDYMISCVPEEAQELVQGCLKINPMDRYTIQNCLTDPWLSQNQECDVVQSEMEIDHVLS